MKPKKESKETMSRRKTEQTTILGKLNLPYKFTDSSTYLAIEKILLKDLLLNLPLKLNLDQSINT